MKAKNFQINFISKNERIIIIKKGWQSKAGRERYTLYQSEDPSPTPTKRMKEEKGITGGD